MRRFNRLIVACLAVVLFALPTLAQDVEEPAHEELREFRKKLVEAILADDIATQLEMTDPDIVTTWQDGRVARGHDGLKAFLDELGKGADRGFLGYKQEPTPGGLTKIYNGNVGVAHGTSIASYELYGMEFDLKNHWTATLLKEDDQWKLVSYHVSGNLADNPLLNAAKKSLWVVGGVAAVVGVIVGLIIGRLRKRPAPATA